MNQHLKKKNKKKNPSQTHQDAGSPSASCNSPLSFISWKSKSNVSKVFVGKRGGGDKHSYMHVCVCVCVCVCVYVCAYTS